MTRANLQGIVTSDRARRTSPDARTLLYEPGALEGARLESRAAARGPAAITPGHRDARRRAASPIPSRARRTRWTSPAGRSREATWHPARAASRCSQPTRKGRRERRRLRAPRARLASVKWSPAFANSSRTRARGARRSCSSEAAARPRGGAARRASDELAASHRSRRRSDLAGRRRLALVRDAVEANDRGPHRRDVARIRAEATDRVIGRRRGARIASRSRSKSTHSATAFAPSPRRHRADRIGRARCLRRNRAARCRRAFPGRSARTGRTGRTHAVARGVPGCVRRDRRLRANANVWTSASWTNAAWCAPACVRPRSSGRAYATSRPSSPKRSRRNGVRDVGRALPEHLSRARARIFRIRRTRERRASRRAGKRELAGRDPGESRRHHLGAAGSLAGHLFPATQVCETLTFTIAPGSTLNGRFPES